MTPDDDDDLLLYLSNLICTLVAMCQNQIAGVFRLTLPATFRYCSDAHSALCSTGRSVFVPAERWEKSTMHDPTTETRKCP